MDPIFVTHLVQDRTQGLQRIADQVRQERSLRSTSAAAPVAPEATSPTRVRATDPRRAPAPAPASTATIAAGCDLAEPAA
jgi:hypothetical protein